MIHLYTDGINEQRIPMTKENGGEMKIVKASEICMQVAGNVSTSFYENTGFDENDSGSFMRPDFRNNKDYLAVMANTLSEEDYAEMLKEGHKPEESEGKDSANTLDKIKTKLAESGVIIKGYNDDLSAEEIEEILGSKVAAEALIKEFSERGLEINGENAEEMSKVFEKASEITEITDGMCDYLLRNAIEPTIDNLYRVRFCAAEVSFKEAGYFTDLLGYKAKDAEGNAYESDEFVKKISGYAKELGIEDRETLIDEADWLVKSKILCNKTNLKTLHELKSLSVPASVNEIAAAIANSYERGFESTKADLIHKDNLRIIAKEAVNVINDADSKDVKKIVAYNMELTVENLRNVKNREYANDISDDNSEFIKNERILQETRVRMTFEASYRLAKQGIAIEKTALEETVNVLKALEDKVSREFFGDDGFIEKDGIYKESQRVIAEMPYIPSKAIGDVLKSGNVFTLKLTFETGTIIKEQFEKAGKEYEALGTQIRSDLGDSVKKTFETAYGILKEFGFEENETYKKAVRILGYSEMEITKENVEEVSKKEAMLERVMVKMTLAAVLRMIKEGVNPLEIPMDRLEAVLDGYENEAIASADNYARFLVKLENRKEISEEERESYIGIYRLLDKIEKSDGAALGSLMKAEAEVNFKNLLTAVRTGKAKGLDIKADLSLGESIRAAGYEFDISGQIMTAFEDFVKNEDSDAFFKKEYESYREMLGKINSQAEEELAALGEETTPANLLAVSEILFDQKDYNPWKKYEDFTKEIVKNRFTETVEKLADSFEDPESAREAYEEVYKEAEDGMKRIAESNLRGYVDIKEIKSAFRQIGLLTKMTNEENYEVPIKVGDEVISIRLKITRKSEKEGKVFASFEDKTFGKILAQFGIRDKAVSGLIAGENAVGLEKLKGDDSFEQNFEKAGFEKVTFNYLQTDIINEDYFRLHFDAGKSDEVTTRELYKVAKTFIETVKGSMKGR